MHKRTYTLLSGHIEDGSPTHEIDVHATQKEIQDFEKQGYLLRESLIKGDHLESLRCALDRIVEVEWETKLATRSAGDRSWGFIPRHLMHKDPAFLDLLKFPPVLSVCRAMMGPLVRLRGLSGRVSFPEEEIQDTPWHQHLRVVSNPIPPWFSQPHCIDALIYLDDLNEDTGPVAVVPGSHAWLDREPPSKEVDAVESQVVFEFPAGSIVMVHGNTWHRALPTRRKKRRMLILSYTPTWLRKSPHGGPSPTDGLIAQRFEEMDEEARILLGHGGYS